MRTQHHAKKASQGDWHPADVKATLEKAGWTLRKLGAHHGVSGKAVMKALRERNLPSEKRIADAIGGGITPKISGLRVTTQTVRAPSCAK